MGMVQIESDLGYFFECWARLRRIHWIYYGANHSSLYLAIISELTSWITRIKSYIYRTELDFSHLTFDMRKTDVEVSIMVFYVKIKRYVVGDRSK